MLEKIQGYKTYIIAVLMVMISAVNLLTGSIGLDEFLASEHLRMLLEGFGLMFLRAGVSKGRMVRAIDHKDYAG